MAPDTGGLAEQEFAPMAAFALEHARELEHLAADEVSPRRLPVLIAARDEIIALRLSLALLEEGRFHLGYEITHSAADAVRRIRADGFGTLFIDAGIAEILRALPDQDITALLAGYPVILLAESATPEAEDLALALGAIGLLTLDDIANGAVDQVMRSAFVCRRLIETLGEYRERIQRIVGHMVTALDANSRHIAQVSHQMRSPLTAILGFSEMMSEQVAGTETDPRTLEYARDIQKSGRRLLEILEALAPALGSEPDQQVRSANSS
ncbi:MAG: hypothetical protein MI755_07310 [Sphingomonadales bacterium]|nr:hypothetical protein [Sphingomonadales bacterium]